MADRELTKLSQLSRAQLQALAERTNRALEMVKDKEIDALVASVRAGAADLGVDLTEVVARLTSSPAARPAAAARVVAAPQPTTKPATGRRRGRRSSPMKGKKIEPWFRDSKTGDTWTGRGRVARWLLDHHNAGRSIMGFVADPSKRDQAKEIEAKLNATQKPARAARSKSAGRAKKTAAA